MANTVLTVAPGLPFVDVTREFATTPEFLVRAHTDPDLFSRWFGKRSVSIKNAAFEVDHGGLWRYTVVLPDGTEASFRGIFHGVPSPGGIIRTVELVGEPGASLEITTFEPKGNTTVLHHRTVFSSVEERDFVVSCAMFDFTEDYEKMDELIDQLAVAV